VTVNNPFNWALITGEGSPAPIIRATAGAATSKGIPSARS